MVISIMTACMVIEMRYLSPLIISSQALGSVGRKIYDAKHRRISSYVQSGYVLGVKDADGVQNKKRETKL